MKTATFNIWRGGPEGGGLPVFIEVRSRDVPPELALKAEVNELTRAVVGDLATAVGLHERNAARIEQQVFGLAGQALGIDRRVFADPDLVGGIAAALLGERAHRVENRQVVDPAQHPHGAIAPI